MHEAAGVRSSSHQHTDNPSITRACSVG